MGNVTITRQRFLDLIAKAYGVKESNPSKLTVRDLVRMSAGLHEPDPAHQLSIREAIRAALEEHAEGLKSRDLNYHIKRHTPLVTRSRNLPALIQSTLGDMQANREVIRKGPKGRSIYKLKDVA